MKTQGQIEKKDSRISSNQKRYIRVTIDGKIYNDWTSKSDAFDTGDFVEIEYEERENPLSSANPFKNITSIAKQIEGGKDWAEKTVTEYTEQLPEKIVKDGALIMQSCYNAITNIIGKQPETDGEIAMCNSLFIWVMREKYFRGRRYEQTGIDA